MINHVGKMCVAAMSMYDCFEKYQPARQNMKFVHSPTSFIFWLGRLIFSVSINSHPDNIYLSWLSQTWSS